MARSSANATLRAASFTGCQSASCAPRSTLSIWARSSLNGTRNCTTGRQERSPAITPSSGGSIAVRCPVPTPASVAPSGPVTSTTLRPAQCSANVRLASSSMLAQAAEETGASSRYRLFMSSASFQRSDAK
jgi:hypothetical protein